MQAKVDEGGANVGIGTSTTLMNLNQHGYFRSFWFLLQFYIVECGLMR